MVELENRGATDLGFPGDRIYISGHDPNIITQIPFNGIQIPPINGKTQFGPGGRDVISFKGIIRPLVTRGVTKLPQRLQITGCYQYETVAPFAVCIDPDPYALTAKPKACIPKNIGGGGGQGGPIAVQNVQLEPAPGRTRFRITVSNTGGGEAFRPGALTLGKCSPYSPQSLDFDEVNFVRLDDVIIAGISIRSSCKPLDQGHIRLLQGQRATLFCELAGIRESAAFTTPLTVVLTYGYRQIQFRDVTIVSAG